MLYDAVDKAENVDTQHVAKGSNHVCSILLIRSSRGWGYNTVFTDHHN